MLRRPACPDVVLPTRQVCSSPTIGDARHGPLLTDNDLCKLDPTNRAGFKPALPPSFSWPCCCMSSSCTARCSARSSRRSTPRCRGGKARPEPGPVERGVSRGTAPRRGGSVVPLLGPSRTRPDFGPAVGGELRELRFHGPPPETRSLTYGRRRPLPAMTEQRQQVVECVRHPHATQQRDRSFNVRWRQADATPPRARRGRGARRHVAA